MHNTVYATLTKSCSTRWVSATGLEVSGTLGIRHDVSSMAVSGKLGGLVGEIPDVTHDPRETSGQLVAGQFGPDCHRLLAENVENIVFNRRRLLEHFRP